MVAVQRNLDNYNKPVYNKVICITSGNLHPTTSNGACKTYGKEPQYNQTFVVASLVISFYHSQFHSSWFNIKSLVFVCRSLSRSKSRSASRSPARVQKQSRSPSPSSPRGASPGGKREDSDNWSCALWDRLFYINCS